MILNMLLKTLCTCSLKYDRNVFYGRFEHLDTGFMFWVFPFVWHILVDLNKRLVANSDTIRMNNVVLQCVNSCSYTLTVAPDCVSICDVMNKQKGTCVTDEKNFMPIDIRNKSNIQTNVFFFNTHVEHVSLMIT